jgi:hypothetical protein
MSRKNCESCFIFSSVLNICMRVCHGKTRILESRMKQMQYRCVVSRVMANHDDAEELRGEVIQICAKRVQINSTADKNLFLFVSDVAVLRCVFRIVLNERVNNL